jgi:hypothetical protein
MLQVGSYQHLPTSGGGGGDSTAWGGGGGIPKLPAQTPHASLGPPRSSPLPGLPASASASASAAAHSHQQQHQSGESSAEAAARAALLASREQQLEATVAYARGLQRNFEAVSLLCRRQRDETTALRALLDVGERRIRELDSERAQAREGGSVF